MYEARQVALAESPHISQSFSGDHSHSSSSWARPISSSEGHINPSQGLVAEHSAGSSVFRYDNSPEEPPITDRPLLIQRPKKGYSRLQVLTEEYSSLPVWNDSTIKCGCKRNNCTKLYCECFKSGQACGPYCSCTGCLNKAKNRRLLSKKKAPEICKCKKSSCTQKYCMCYRQKRFCTDKCKCRGCGNKKQVVETKNIVKISKSVLPKDYFKDNMFGGKEIVLQKLNSLSFVFKNS